MTQTIASILQPGIDAAIEKAAEHLNPSSREQRLGPLLATYARSGSGKTLLTLACYADAMRVVYHALLADGEITGEEADYAESFLGTVAECFSKFRQEYVPFVPLKRSKIGAFLKQYEEDSGPFGLQDESTKWSSISVLRNIAEQCDDNASLKQFRATLVHAAETLLKADGMSDEEEEFLRTLKTDTGYEESSDTQDSGSTWFINPGYTMCSLRNSKIQILIQPAVGNLGITSIQADKNESIPSGFQAISNVDAARILQALQKAIEGAMQGRPFSLDDIDWSSSNQDESSDDENEADEERCSDDDDDECLEDEVDSENEELIESLFDECERLLAGSKGQESIMQVIEEFIESEGENALEAIERLVDHDESRLREAVLVAAGKHIGKKLEPETVLPVYIQKCFDEDSDVRSAAIGILEEKSQLVAPYILNFFLADPINRNPVGILFGLFQDQRLEIAEKLKGVVPQNPEELTGADRVAIGCVFERIASLKSSEWQSLEEREGELTGEERALCVKLRKEALKEAELAVKLDPSLQRSCWGLLADLKRQAGDSSLAEALELYNESCEAESWDEKSTLLKKSLAAAPTFYWSHNNLAWHLAAAPDPEERDGAAAVNHALKACDLDGYHYWGLLDTLAAAYAENGQFDLAVKWLTKAIENCPEDTSELESLLERYESGQAYPYEQPDGDDDESNDDGGWEFSQVTTNQGFVEGRDRSYLLVPLDEFVRNASFSEAEMEKINASKQKTWWDEGWDVDFRATVGRKFDELGFCNDPGQLKGFTLDMGNGPSFDYRIFRVHESFLSLDRKIGDLPQHDGKWFIKIYDKEEDTAPYRRLCELLGLDRIERYRWSVFE